MRELVWILQRRFVDQRLPLLIAKAYLLILLAGLDYFYTECRVVHTGNHSIFIYSLKLLLRSRLLIFCIHPDLKLDNILMTFENEDVLPNFLKEQITNCPMQCKTDAATG